MKKQTQQRALDNWFEIGRVGTATDKNGKTVSFSENDLDGIISNADVNDPAPLVIGHPKENNPAYGWTATLKRDGTSLFAKADEYVDQFSDWVDKKLYRKRSMALKLLSDGTYKLIHIGFLGAKPPAIEGMQDLQYATNTESIVFELSVEDAVLTHGWKINSVGRVLRNLKNRLIASDGVDEADEALPEYLIDDLSSTSETTRAQLDDDNHFSQHQDEGENKVKTFNLTESELQSQIETAVNAAVTPLNAELAAAKNDSEQREFAGRVADATAVLDAAVEKGTLLPAQTPGLAEFMAGLSSDSDESFEFSVGDGAKAQKKTDTPFEFAKRFIESLGKQLNVGGRDDEAPESTSRNEFSAPTGATVDESRSGLHTKAMEYSTQHKVSYTEAVIAVSE